MGMPQQPTPSTVTVCDLQYLGSVNSYRCVCCIPALLFSLGKDALLLTHVPSTHHCMYVHLSTGLRGALFHRLYPMTEVDTDTGTVCWVIGQ